MARTVQAKVAFLNDQWRNREETPRIYSRASRHANTSRREVLIHDARALHQASPLSLETNGFVLLNRPTEFREFDDDAAVKSRYFEEMKAVIQQVTQADQVFPFPFYQVRSRNPVDFYDAYALYVHCDFSEKTWLKLARAVIRKAGGPQDLSDDRWYFSMFNLWRPTGAPAQRDPLTLIDASTVEEKDLVDYYVSPPGEETTLAALPLYNESQRFYYFSDIQPDEVLVFKQHDTRFEGPQVCPHSSFEDPSSSPDAPDRRSIEVRMICLHQRS